MFKEVIYRHFDLPGAFTIPREYDEIYGGGIFTPTEIEVDGRFFTIRGIYSPDGEDVELDAEIDGRVVGPGTVEWYLFTFEPKGVGL